MDSSQVLVPIHGLDLLYISYGRFDVIADPFGKPVERNASRLDRQVHALDVMVA